MCNCLASAGISPVPLRLQKGAWQFDTGVIVKAQELIEDNLTLDRFPISGGYKKCFDYFQLYP
jgi:hypothetical protein